MIRIVMRVKDTRKSMKALKNKRKNKSQTYWRDSRKKASIRCTWRNSWDQSAHNWTKNSWENPPTNKYMIIDRTDLLPQQTVIKKYPKFGSWSPKLTKRWGRSLRKITRTTGKNNIIDAIFLKLSIITLYNRLIKSNCVMDDYQIFLEQIVWWKKIYGLEGWRV